MKYNKSNMGAGVILKLVLGNSGILKLILVLSVNHSLLPLHGHNLQVKETRYRYNDRPSSFSFAKYKVGHIGPLQFNDDRNLIYSSPGMSLMSSSDHNRQKIHLYNVPQNNFYGSSKLQSKTHASSKLRIRRSPSGQVLYSAPTQHPPIAPTEPSLHTFHQSKFDTFTGGNEREVVKPQFQFNGSGYPSQLKLYPPLGTLGTYGEDWFPDAYKNNHRKKDRSSTGAPGVEITSLSMPDLIREGDNITLICHFRLLGHNQRVYTVNWWRDGALFFTYSQHKNDNRSSYRFEGIAVDEKSSSERSVVLVDVSEITSGRYKCEVMTEGPAFKTAVMYRNMTVVVPPSSVELRSNKPSLERPRDTSRPPLYNPGDDVKFNCTAKSAKPKPELSWRINNQLVSTTYQYPDRSNANGRVTSKIGLKFAVPHFFKKGKATVTCVVEVHGERLTSTSETVYVNVTAISYRSSRSASEGLEPSSILATVLLLLTSLTEYSQIY